MKRLALREAHRASRMALALAIAHVCACGADRAAEAPFETNPAAARFVTSDVEHFWTAYDAGGRSGSAPVFQTRYLDLASPALTDFVELRAVTAKSVANMVGARPRYFDAIRGRSLTLAENAPVLTTLRDNDLRVKELYPAAVFPPVTFLFGRFSTAGTISPHGMLIGAEFFGADEATPLDELVPFERNNVRPLGSLPIMVAHEHIHILQARGSRMFSHPDKNLLEQALLEGSADFVAEIVSGGNSNARIFPFGMLNERDLWREFQAQMHGTDVSRWLYNQGYESTDRPGDLGYFVGYRIAQAFHQRALDKAASIAAIIEMSDADDFLARSGYAP